MTFPTPATHIEQHYKYIPNNYKYEGDEEWKDYKRDEIRTQRLKEESLENKMLFKLYDLCFMFNHYRTLPIVKNLGKVNPNYSSLDSYNKLSSAFSELESNFEDGLIPEEDFKNFLLPINTALSGIDFSEIFHISNERHGIAHSDTRSAKKQMQFLQECKTYNFLYYQTLANAMISQLDLVALKRMN